MRCRHPSPNSCASRFPAPPELYTHAARKTLFNSYWQANIRLKSDAPRGEAALERSMHKTYTDCY